MKEESQVNETPPTPIFGIQLEGQTSLLGGAQNFYNFIQPIKDVNEFVNAIKNEREIAPLYTDELLYKDDELRGGTLRALMYWLLRLRQKEYTNSIILTHTRYRSSVEFLNLLFEIFNGLSDTEGLKDGDIREIRDRMIKFIRKWMKNNFNDFKEYELSIEINKKIKSLKKDFPGENWSEYLSSAFKQELTLWTEDTALMSEYEGAPKSLLTQKLRKQIETLSLEEIDIGSLGVLDFHAKEIARQLTLIDHDAFRKIPITELLKKAFEKPKLSPRVQEINNFFNNITRWVGSEIVKCTAVKDRIKRLCQFISICEYFKELQNFHGLMAIFAGLSQFAISRLKASWKLPSLYAAKWSELGEILNPVGNFKVLRQLQQNSEPPVVPCLSLLFHDLVLIEDGNDEYTSEDNKFLNIEKALMLGKSFDYIIKTRKCRYFLNQVDVMQTFFLDIKKEKLQSILTLDQITQVSREIEPTVTH